MIAGRRLAHSLQVQTVLPYMSAIAPVVFSLMMVPLVRLRARHALHRARLRRGVGTYSRKAVVPGRQVVHVGFGLTHTRFQVNGSLNYLVNAWGGSHTLRVGGEYAVDHLIAPNDGYGHPWNCLSTLNNSVLNANAAQALTTTSGGSRLRPTAIAGPRILRIGGRWDW